MNYEMAKTASFENGFKTRLQQLMVKSALNPRMLWQMANRASRAGQSISRVGGPAEQAMAKISPKFQLPQQMTTNPRMLANLGEGTTSLGSAQRMTELARANARGAGRAVGPMPVMPPRFGASGSVTAALRGGMITPGRGGAAAMRRQALQQGVETGASGQAYTKPLKGKALEARTAPAVADPGFAKVSPEMPGAPASGPALGTAGGGKTPGTISNKELEELGLIGPSSGDPTGGLLGRIKGMLPAGAQSWMAENPNAVAGGLGALGGGGLMAAGDAYGDRQRRKAVENLGMMDRLGLAFQLATNPQGFASTLRL